ncbi:uncharacterized protein LOC107042476 [Diachasma alloeum]|uniref:uncharacterized protein LOC107042476 n=1 Tax=Diachasma alloeum TaxID=454923 RepID=UPI00073825AF|nr:uncharacterized protein LOC107042476 [Diachasma alloeum]
MFRQILVHQDNRHLQLILWRKDPDHEAQVYQFNTVTYGTTCAPYHGMRRLRELAALYKAEFPLASRVLEEDFYMDDLLTGTSTPEVAIQLQQQLSKLLMLGQFPLRKWRSNDPQILRGLQEHNKTEELFTIDKEEALKTLGLFWNAPEDILQYHVQLSQDSVNTKRQVLSRISQIFDPLELVGPVLVSGKILMQKLWSDKIDWDESLPEEIQTLWDDYYMSLPAINDIQISRNVNLHNREEKFDLHGFGDASERAFGACLYAVSTDHQGNPQSHLLCAKSKVAPLKVISVPRLELEAALLLTQLYQTMKTTFIDKIGQVTLWSDSTIVLGWVKTKPSILKTFVANRVAKIQEQTKHINWLHVPTDENPADLISRGVSPKDLKESKLWWNSPHYLQDENKRPTEMKNPATDLPEVKITEVTLTSMLPTKILHRCSSESFSETSRIVAYCFRFLSAFTEQKEPSPLNVEELNKAEKIIIKWVQHQEFPIELHCLKEEREIPRKSVLRSLSPFLDCESLIRVGGRLKYASVSENQKHPMVLPAKNHITNIIMSDEHVRLHHCPPEQLLHAVRQRFWPLSGRREAQKVVKHCLKCFRFNPRIPGIMMGELPKERVRGDQRPFTVSGVDYAGPIQVRESRRRGRIHISKGYIAVFVCFATKAVHLELVSDLTTEAYLAALNRFTARRGVCSQLYSDNGTNFVGTSRALSEIFEFLTTNETELVERLAKQRISWSFIPPRSPHFGGLWEAAVKIMKRHLNTVTQGRVMTYEEYYTLLTEIEAILNSRPLTPLTNHPDDLQVLTPAHFLIGESLLQPVSRNLLEMPENRLSRWQLCQKLRQQVWAHWQKEYLQELQKRVKWTDSSEPIELNTLVLLIEDNVSPLHWPLGRVIELHPGADGLVRVATVNTSTGNFKRAVKKICPLPMDVGED